MGKTGFPISYEKPGKMDVKQFFKAGYKVKDDVRHNDYLEEYVGNCLHEQPEIAKYHNHESSSPSTTTDDNTIQSGMWAIVDTHKGRFSGTCSRSHVGKEGVLL